MSCHTFDFGCQIGTFLSPWLFWIKAAGITIVVLVAIWVLAKIKEIGGWPALMGALIAAAAAGGYIVRARQDHKVTTPRDPYYLTLDNAKDVQRALAARHLYPGKIDGDLRTQTRNGIRALQRQIGETPTGTLTPRVLAALGLHFGGR